MQAAVSHLRRSDPVMAAIIDRVGPCRLTALEPVFETLARSITFQQLHGKAAASIFARLQAKVGKRFTARALLKLSEDELRACGLSRQKTAALTDLAQKVASRQLDFRKFGGMDNASVLAALTQVRGVGEWTAQIFLMFALERLDVIPVGDLGIRNAIQKAYGLKELPKPKDLLRFAEKWQPYAAVASWYLWRSLDGPADMG